MTHPSFPSFPDADETFIHTAEDGAVLPIYRLNGPRDAPALLFGHANGLAAGSYAPWLKALARQVQVFAFDARGHGASRWPDGPLDEVIADARIIADLAAVSAAVTARLGGAPLTYAGHSLGAVTALSLLAEGAETGWHAFVGFEPPVFPAPQSPSWERALADQTRLVEGTAKRRALWPSPEAYADRLSRSPMCARFVPEMLLAHCRATLRPLAEGGYTLACPPAVESTIYRGHRNAATWAGLGRIALPVSLVSGDPALPDNEWISRVMPEMADAIPGAVLTVLPGTGHMLIFEAPERCAALVLAAVFDMR